MGKVQARFGNGFAGAVSRSIDDIIISVRNAGSVDIPFGAPVFMTSDGAVPFDISDPQDFTTFLGFAVRVADKTPDEYPSGQFGTPPQGVLHPGDVMEVLVRGSIAVASAAWLLAKCSLVSPTPTLTICTSPPSMLAATPH